jgi:DNA-binding CsgD family transcriptional regulator
MAQRELSGPDPVALVAGLYEAAWDGDWEAAGASICRALGASRGCWIAPRAITSWELSGPPLTSSWEASMVRDYADHYEAVDPYWPAAMRMPEGTPVARADLVADREYERSELYCDLMRANGIYHVLGARLDLDPKSWLAVSFFADADARPFGREARGLLDRLLPHLRRAAQLHARVAEDRWLSRASLDYLNRLPHGLLLLDGRGRPRFHNTAAALIFEQDDGLRLGTDTLRAGNPEDRRSLDGLIAGAAGAANGTGLASGGVQAIRRPSGRRPYQLLVTPLGPSLAERFGSLDPAVALFVSDPEEVHETPAAWLARLHGLTPAEARLALALAGGSRLEDAAERFGITRTTARNQLRSIFQKTDTHRQAELVRLLLLTPPG